MSRQGTINKKLGSLDGTNLAGVVPLPRARPQVRWTRFRARSGSCAGGARGAPADGCDPQVRVRAVHGVHCEGPAWR